MAFELRPHQLKAVDQMHTGCILCGGTGSGKTLTSLAYYYLQYGGSREFLTGGEYRWMDTKRMPPLYVITTPRKRDLLEWEGEMCVFLLGTGDQISKRAYPDHTVIVDSWNNIKKYKDVKNAFFIFDEDKVTGSGAWVKAFLKIAKSNEWVILSATPGDTYEDYMAVFVANGFYKNITEFKRDHIVYSPYCSYPRVERYIGTERLNRLRRRVLIPMQFQRPTTQHHRDIWCEFDKRKYQKVMRDRWNVFEDCPIDTASRLCYVLRKVTNSDVSRGKMVLDILESHPRAIIFYNFDYELDILKALEYDTEVNVAEWNSHAHDRIPSSEKWVYLVQYTAGAEGWNCITTDTVIFYSQNYSYKVLAQSIGRTDRLNTPYKDLYYYHLKSKANIDLAISRKLRDKKKFNESAWLRKSGDTRNYGDLPPKICAKTTYPIMET